MGRRKGSGKNKVNTSSTLDQIVTKLKEVGIAASDLAKKYNKGKPVTATVLVDVFERYRPKLEKMQVKNTRGRYSGQLRPAKPDEIISAFAQKIANEIGKTSQAGEILEDLKRSAAIKLQF